MYLCKCACGGGGGEGVYYTFVAVQPRDHPYQGKTINIQSMSVKVGNADSYKWLPTLTDLGLDTTVHVMSNLEHRSFLSTSHPACSSTNSDTVTMETARSVTVT